MPDVSLGSGSGDRIYGDEDTDCIWDADAMFQVADGGSGIDDIKNNMHPSALNYELNLANTQCSVPNLIKDYKGCCSAGEQAPMKQTPQGNTPKQQWGGCDDGSTSQNTCNQSGKLWVDAKGTTTKDGMNTVRLY